MMMTQFYDAHEDLDAETGRRASNSGDNSSALNTTPRPLGAPAVETLGVKAADASGAREQTATSESSVSEDKYIVKNRDTGEVYDIRDLASLPSDSYSIFPNDFLPPQEEEVEADVSAQTPVGASLIPWA